MSVLDSPQYVSEGDQMVYSGQFGPFLFSKGPTQLVADVTATLQNTYHLAVQKYENSVSDYGLGTGTITLHLESLIDRGDGEQDDGLTDILNNVNDAFRKDGYSPAGSAISQYTPAPTTDPVTGASIPQAPIATNSPLPTAEQSNAAKTSNPTDSWWSKLVGQVEAGSIGVVIGSAAVIGLLIYLSVKPE
jgi:hypothetical protein